MTSRDSQKDSVEMEQPIVTEMDSATDGAKEDPQSLEQVEQDSGEADKKNNGQPFAKDGGADDVSNGPRLERGCTDIPCLVLFLAMLGGLFYIGGKAFVNGDARIVLYGKDHDGKVCGVSEGVEDFPFLYWPTIDPPPKKQPLYQEASNYEALMAHNKAMKLGVCTKKCPDEYSHASRLDMCPEKDQKHCTWYARNSKQVLGQYCFFKPNNAELGMQGLVCAMKNTTSEEMAKLDTAIQNEIDQLVTSSELQEPCAKKLRALKETLATDVEATHQTLSQSVAEGDMDAHNCKDVGAETEGFWSRIMGDVFKAKKLIFIFAPLCALGLGLLYLAFLKCFARIIIAFVWLIMIGLLVCAFYLHGQSREFMMDGLDKDANACITGSIACALGATVLGFLMICSGQQLAVAVNVLGTTSECLLQTKSMLFLPMIAVACAIAWIIYIILACVHIFAEGVEILPAPTELHEIGNKRYRFSTESKIGIVVHLFAFLCGNAFIAGVCTTALATAAAFWYFAPRDEENDWRQLPQCLAFKGLGLTLRYHVGSIAVGAILLAIVQLLQFALAYLERNMKACEGNAIMGVMAKILGGMLCCLECCVRWINNKAYLMVGILGKSFCGGAIAAAELIARNPVRFVMVEGLGWMLGWIGAIFISAGTSAICAAIMWEWREIWTCRSVLGPLVMCSILAFSMGTMITSVMGTTADAIFFCFVIDEEMNKGDAEKGPQAMKDFVNDKHMQGKAVESRSLQYKERMCCAV